MTTEAYPLSWPEGWKRTKQWRRAQAAFNTGFAKARDGIVHEIRLLNGTMLVLSTNHPLRRDGLPYASQAQPDDVGVAVYFQYKKQYGRPPY